MTSGIGSAVVPKAVGASMQSPRCGNGGPRTHSLKCWPRLALASLAFLLAGGGCLPRTDRHAPWPSLAVAAAAPSVQVTEEAQFDRAAVCRRDKCRDLIYRCGPRRHSACCSGVPTLFGLLFLLLLYIDDELTLQAAKIGHPDLCGNRGRYRL